MTSRLLTLRMTIASVQQNKIKSQHIYFKKKKEYAVAIFDFGEFAEKLDGE